jgi:hypothetical protein
MLFCVGVNLVSHSKGAEENIWTYEGGSGRRLEMAA